MPCAHVYGNPLILVVPLRGFRAGDEPFHSPVRAERRGEKTRVGAYLHTRESVGPRERARRQRLGRYFHEIMPDRARTVNPADAHHRLVVRVTHPDARHQVRRVTDSPVIPPVGCGAGLGCRRPTQVQRTEPAESRRSGQIVTQDVGDQERHPRIQNPMASHAFVVHTYRDVLQQNVPLQILHFPDRNGNHIYPAVGKSTVGRRDVQ